MELWVLQIDNTLYTVHGVAPAIPVDHDNGNY
jgi:hypothetical protein